MKGTGGCVMIRTIWLMLALFCFGLPRSNSVVAHTYQQPLASQLQISAFAPSQEMSRLAIELANHVITLIKRDSQDPRDHLVREARKLLSRESQRRLRQDLQHKLGGRAKFDREEEFKRLLAEVDAILTPAKLEELRQELRRGKPVTQSWPWPLCVIGGCR
jgi:hypothetical protein